MKRTYDEITADFKKQNAARKALIEENKAKRRKMKEEELLHKEQCRAAQNERKKCDDYFEKRKQRMIKYLGEYYSRVWVTGDATFPVTQPLTGFRVSLETNDGRPFYYYSCIVELTYWHQETELSETFRYTSAYGGHGFTVPTVDLQDGFDPNPVVNWNLVRRVNDYNHRKATAAMLCYLYYASGICGANFNSLEAGESGKEKEFLGRLEDALDHSLHGVFVTRCQSSLMKTAEDLSYYRKEAAKMGMSIQDYLRKAESIMKELESGHISREFQD